MALSLSGLKGRSPCEKKMDDFKGHLYTWFFSLLCSIIVGWAWVYTHPTPKYAKVDIKSLVAQETLKLSSQVTPNLSQNDQEKLLADASKIGVRIDKTIAQLAQECNCIILNSAAILGGEGKYKIPDLTNRAKQILSE